MDLVTRAKNMILAPAAEWPVVAGESTSVADLYRSYILPLSAIPPVAALIGTVVFGRFGLGTALYWAVASYILGLISVYILGWVASLLAPMFGATGNLQSGLKLAAYSSTAQWVGGIFTLIPALSILSLLAWIYSIYVSYTGITPIMNVAPERRLGYFIALVIASIVVFFVIGVIVSRITGVGIGPAAI